MGKTNILTSLLTRSAIAASCLVGLPAAVLAGPQDTPPPGSAFDLSYWKITLPIDGDDDGRVDEVDVGDIQDFSHPDFFYLNAEGDMVFTAPNRATTTSGSSNTRSELRQMLRGTSTRIGTPKASVDQVAVKAQCPDRNPAYSVVVGQIHAVGYDDTSSGFGYGNEPIKIYYLSLIHI